MECGIQYACAGSILPAILEARCLSKVWLVGTRLAPPRTDWRCGFQCSRFVPIPAGDCGNMTAPGYSGDAGASRSLATPGVKPQAAGLFPTPANCARSRTMSRAWLRLSNWRDSIPMMSQATGKPGVPGPRFPVSQVPQFPSFPGFPGVPGRLGLQAQVFPGSRPRPEIPSRAPGFPGVPESQPGSNPPQAIPGQVPRIPPASPGFARHSQGPRFSPVSYGS